MGLRYLLVTPPRRRPCSSPPAAHPAAAAPVPQSYAGKRAVVVGAGPAGSTAAMFLARRGFAVDVYERRPEPSQDAVDTGEGVGWAVQAPGG